MKENELSVNQLRDKRKIEIHNQPLVDNEIQIYVKTLIGKILTISCQLNYTIEEIKEKIQDIEGIFPYDQRIFFKGKQLEDSRVLSD